MLIGPFQKKLNGPISIEFAWVEYFMFSTTFVDRLYYCVIGVLPKYGMTLSFDFFFGIDWRFNECP